MPMSKESFDIVTTLYGLSSLHKIDLFSFRYIGLVNLTGPDNNKLT